MLLLVLLLGSERGGGVAVMKPAPRVGSRIVVVVEAGSTSAAGVVVCGIVDELEPRGVCAARRGGGGAGGAWTLTRRLEERERVESNEERRADGSVPSSWSIDAALE